MDNTGNTNTIGVMTPVEPYSPEWFKLRLGCFTASEIFKLMTDPRSNKAKEAGELSEGAHTYVLQKVHEKVTGTCKPSFDSFSTQWGVENEPLARSWYERLSKNNVQEPYLVFHETIQGFSCTPDAFVNDNGLLEIKCPSAGENHLDHCFITNNEDFKKNFPNKYWQMIAQIAICGKDFCDFVSFDPRVPTGFGFFKYQILRSEVQSDIDLLESKVSHAVNVRDEYVKMFMAA